MAFQSATTTSRSYTNLSNNTSDIHRNNSSAALSATLGNGTGPWGNTRSSIWRNASLTAPFVPKLPSNDNGDIKKGSGSLLASSESDTPPWRASNGRGSEVNIRLNTNTAQGYCNPDSIDPSGEVSPTTTRNPAINLTNQFPVARPAFATAQPAGLYGSNAPAVYTKFRNENVRPVDSVVSPASTATSPLSERRPQWPTSYTQTMDSSRDTSRAPTSSHSDKVFNFMAENNKLRQDSYSARTHSISSQQSNALVFGNMNAVNPEFMPTAFSHLSLEQHDRSVSKDPPTQQYAQQYSQLPGFEVERDGYTRSTASSYSTQPHFSYVNSRLLQDPRTFDFQAGQLFDAVQYGSRAQQHDFTASQKYLPAWQDTSTSALAVRREMPQQQSLDIRFPDQITVKDQYVFDPYNLASVQGVNPYINYFNVNLNSMNGVMQPGLAPPPPPMDLVEGGVQSAKLYEFKLAGKNNRRYELKDIYDYIAEFAGDQHGSRFIQTKLETANSDEKERVFREIEPNAIPLMTDVFGNYVIQKFFDHGQQEHKKILAHKMKGQVLNLSTQMYGCRVVQKALEHVLLEQQASLVSELEHHVLKCVKDQNGNHVIQKAIERCPPASIKFVYHSFVGQVHGLSLHPYGCRVIQRCLERQGDFPAKDIILRELHDGMPKGMIGDSYGNYVVQHVVENGPEDDRQHVLSLVLADLEGYSKHKFASNVVEKCIQHSQDTWRRQVVEVLTTIDERRAEAEGVLVGLIKDSYGNYVIQKLLDSLSPQDFVYFHQHLQPAMAYTKRIGAGKQVVSIEKKMQRFEELVTRMNAAPMMKPTSMNGIPSIFQQQQSRQHNGSEHSPVGYRYSPNAVNRGPFPLSIPSHAYANMYGSVSNTPPPLTSDSRSIQSSGIPSVNGDAVEGATSMSRKNSEAPVDSVLLR